MPPRRQPNNNNNNNNNENGNEARNDDVGQNVVGEPAPRGDPAEAAAEEGVRAGARNAADEAPVFKPDAETDPRLRAKMVGHLVLGSQFSGIPETPFRYTGKSYCYGIPEIPVSGTENHLEIFFWFFFGINRCALVPIRIDYCSHY